MRSLHAQCSLLPAVFFTASSVLYCQRSIDAEASVLSIRSLNAEVCVLCMPNPS